MRSRLCNHNTIQKAFSGALPLFALTLLVVSLTDVQASKALSRGPSGFVDFNTDVVNLDEGGMQKSVKEKHEFQIMVGSHGGNADVIKKVMCINLSNDDWNKRANVELKPTTGSYVIKELFKASEHVHDRFLIQIVVWKGNASTDEEVISVKTYFHENPYPPKCDGKKSRHKPKKGFGAVKENEIRSLQTTFKTTNIVIGTTTASSTVGTSDGMLSSATLIDTVTFTVRKVSFQMLGPTNWAIGYSGLTAGNEHLLHVTDDFGGSDDKLFTP